MKISVLSAVFIEFQVQVIANCLVDMKKHQTIDIFLMSDFYEFLKIDNFPNFPKFSENHCMCFILCYMFDKTQCNLMGPFSNDIFTNLVSTSDFNVEL